MASEPTRSHKPRHATPARHRMEHESFDAWLIWSIAVIAIGFPVFVLICVSSIPVDELDCASLRIAASHGEFLVPILIMCAESIRRWVREVKTKASSYMTAFKAIACLMCASAGAVCMTAAIISATTSAATTKAMQMTGQSITEITLACVIVGLIFGTAGVIAGPRT